jgi:hypothetical protein
VAIHVEASGRVLVDAPVGATHAAVAQAVKKRAAWITQHVERAKARLEHVRHRDYTSGETVHYLGRRYRLRVTVDPSAAASCRLRGGFLEVTVQRRAALDVQAAMSAWLRHRAVEVLRERLHTIAAGLRWVKVAAADAPAMDACAVGQLLAAWAHHSAPGPGAGASRLHRLRRAPRTVPPGQPRPQRQVLPAA